MISRTMMIAMCTLLAGLAACGGEEAGEPEDIGTEPADTLSDDVAETSRAPEMIFASHILLPFQGSQQAPADAMSRDEAYELLESVADSISAGQLTFDEAAARYSTCPSGQQGGFLGGFVRGQMVPEFEEVAFNLEPGNMSGVFETGYGYHIVYREPTVTASHILIAYQGADRSTATRTKEEALELIEALKDSVWSGELAFEEAARRYSDCPSAQQGGDLGPFARGMMAPAFEDAAFGIGVDDISDITETPFGYHLILRTN